jgi:hypothetical protein
VLTELAASVQKDLDEKVLIGGRWEMQLNLYIANWAENPFIWIQPESRMVV